MTHAFPSPSGPQWPPLPPAAASKPPKPKRLPWIAGIVVAFVLGLTIGGSSSSSPPSSATAARTTQTVTVVAPAPQPPERQADAPPAASGPLTSFSAGTYEVGTGDGQVAPGKYKTQGGGPIGSCYWARLKNTDGDFESIITNGNAEGPTTVTIGKNDGAFETRCTWTKAG